MDNMRKWFYSLVVLLVICTPVFAQQEDDEPLTGRTNIHVTVDTNRYAETYGENRRWFVHVNYGVAWHLGPAAQGAAVLPRSLNYYWGFRTKLKLVKWDALCLDINIGQERWNMRQESAKLLPDSILHKAERLQFNYLQGKLVNRINFNRHRGNVIGTYLDFGVYGNWLYRNLHITKDKLTVPGFDSKVRTERAVGIPYMEPIQYGFTVRFGSENFALETCYRMSNYFKPFEQRSLPELPRLWFGFVVSVY